MSMSIKVCLILGVEVNYYDYETEIDKLSSTSGEIAAISCGYDNPGYVVGKKIAEWDERDYEEKLVQYAPNSDDQKLVDTWLFQNLKWIGESAKLYFIASAS